MSVEHALNRQLDILNGSLELLPSTVLAAALEVRLTNIRCVGGHGWVDDVIGWRERRQRTPA